MWTFLTGYLLSNIFEQGVIELFEEKFSNKTITIDKVFVGWLFQEYIKKKLRVTGGKMFLLKNDHRNMFLTQSLKLTMSLSLYSHLIIFLELGTLLLILCIFSYCILSKICSQKLNYKTFPKSILLLVSNQNCSLRRIFLFISLIVILRYGFFKTFFYFDFFLSTRLILLIFFSVFSLLIFFIVSYLLYLAAFKKLSKNTAFIVKVFYRKFFVYSFYIVSHLTIIINTLNSQNLITENFFKEKFSIVLLFSQLL